MSLITLYDGDVAALTIGGEDNPAITLGTIIQASSNPAAIPQSEKGAPNGVATLGGDGLVPLSQLPNISIGTTYVVNSQAAQEALPAVVGDIAVRTDENKSYILVTEPASVFANWQELLAAGAVSSVNGDSGPAVVLVTDDIAEGVTNLYYTDTRVAAAPSVVANSAKVSADGSIDTHSDVDTTTSAPAIGESLAWNGTHWVPTPPGSAPVISVNGLTGAVILTTDAVPEASNLYYTETRVANSPSVVANTAKVSADGSINDHNDVDTITSPPLVGEFLQWNGSDWVPNTPPGAPVTSVNGGTGVVVLDAVDVGADPSGTAVAEVASHEAALDPHPQYALETSLATVATTGDHGDLANVGTNTHAQLDSHVADASIHFTEASIDHTAITNVGTNTHAQLDSHVADAAIHFTEASIDHTAITNVGTNTHAQLDSHVASTANPHNVTAAQAGADPVGTAAAAVAAHEAALDPHPQYTTTAEAAAAAPVQSVNGDTGVVVLDTDDIAEGVTNLYYTETRVNNNASVVANSAKVSADGSIDTHSDVDTTTSPPSVGERLEWDGSNWVPAPVSVFGQDYSFNVSDPRQTTTLATFQTAFSHVTPALTGTYLVTWEALVDQSSTSSSVEADFLIDAGGVGTIQRHEPKDVADNYKVGATHEVVFSGAARTLEIVFREQGGGTAGIEQMRIIYWRVA